VKRRFLKTVGDSLDAVFEGKDVEVDQEAELEAAKSLSGSLA
jgi:hypothetical protein